MTVALIAAYVFLRAADIAMCDSTRWGDDPERGNPVRALAGLVAVFAFIVGALSILGELGALIPNAPY